LSVLAWSLLAGLGLVLASWAAPKNLIPRGHVFSPHGGGRSEQSAQPHDGPPGSGQLHVLLAALLSQLSVGAEPTQAWAHSWQALLPGYRLMTPAELAARSPGVATRTIAAAWSLAEETGAPLADVLGSVQSGIRLDEELAAAIELELVGPRATVKILLSLPLLGLLLGEFIGAHPLRVLLFSNFGRGCLFLGLLFHLIGYLWMRAWIRQTQSFGEYKNRGGVA
ncbi:MAG: type II secretion system F family protein, partial [Angustibacter sp.]